jgi:phosphate uptake regulator
MFRDVVPALEGSDVELARKILKDHKNVSTRVERGLQLLRSDQVLQGQSGRAVTAALYLRYLKRVSAHIKNVATSVLNPYHRIGFKEKKKGGRGGSPTGPDSTTDKGPPVGDDHPLEEIELIGDDEARD